MALTMGSPLAAVLLIGVWCEADDQGVFLWKPITLKARILPAANVDVESLLAELVENRFVIRFTADGRDYGAIRNFRVWQRPKKPNETHPLPHEYRTFVGLKDDSSEPVRNQFPTGGEKSPQREEVGGRMEDVSSPPLAPLAGGHDDAGKKTPCGSGEQKARPKRAARLPDDWEPNSDDRAFAVARGLSPARIDDLALEFRNYWTSLGGQRACKLDWSKTWQNRVLQVTQGARPTGPPHADPDEVDRLLAEKANAH